MSNNKELSRYEILRQERRYLLVSVDLYLVGQMFLDSDVTYSFEGVPKDAIFVSAERDIQHQSFSFIYLHESFVPVPKGGLPAPVFLTVHTKQSASSKQAS